MKRVGHGRRNGGRGGGAPVWSPDDRRADDDKRREGHVRSPTFGRDHPIGAGEVDTPKKSDLKGVRHSSMGWTGP